MVASTSRSSSPTPSSVYSAEDNNQSSASTSGSRKRTRSDLSAEERKEARAHRNRLAAQHSRDKRKAQMSYLEERVAQLEEENAALKRGGNTAPPPAKKRKEDDKETQRERENEELRERIKSLEQGWDAVVKALHAQGGLPAGILPTIGASSSDIVVGSQSPTLSANSPPMSPSVNSYPLLDNTALPFTFDFTTPLLSSSQTPEMTALSTRHLAAGGQGLSITETDNENQQEDENENEKMETLFREILADHSSLGTPSTAPMILPDPMNTTSVSEAWNSSGLEDDVQRLFGLIPETTFGLGLDGINMDLSTGLDPADWMDDLNMTFPANSSSSVGVF